MGFEIVGVQPVAQGTARLLGDRDNNTVGAAKAYESHEDQGVAKPTLEHGILGRRSSEYPSQFFGESSRHQRRTPKARTTSTAFRGGLSRALPSTAETDDLDTAP